MSVLLSPTPRFRVVNTDGTPAVGAQIYTFVSGTSTPLASYQDSAGTTPNPSPVICDARGECDLWLTNGALYTITAKDATGATIWSRDGISTGQAIVTNPGADQTISTGHLAVPAGIDAPIGTVTPASVTATDLTVTSSTSKQRIVNVVGLGQMFSANLQADGTSRDVAGRWGIGIAFDTINSGLKARFVNPAGTVRDYAPRLTIGCSFTDTVNTGNTTLNTIWSRTVIGGTIGSGGGIRIRLYFNATVQGAGGSAFYIYLGGVQVCGMLLTASTTGRYKYTVTIGNRGAQNSQIVYAEPTYLGGSASATILNGSFATTAVDTSADQVLAIAAQNAANSDSNTLQIVEVENVTTFSI